jgi:Spy/CpxP family protein refolding chaperone
MTRIQSIAPLRGLRLLAVVLALGCSALMAQPGGGGGGMGGPGGGGGSPDMMGGGGMPDMDLQFSYTPTAKSDLKSLTKKLKLTEDQQSQIKAILTGRDDQITALVKQAATERKASSTSSTTSGAQQSPGPETMMAVFMKERTIKETANSEIEEVLTADQMKKFESWTKNQEKNQMEGGMGGPGGGMPVGGGMPGGGGGPM